MIFKTFNSTKWVQYREEKQTKWRTKGTYRRQDYFMFPIRLWRCLRPARPVIHLQTRCKSDLHLPVVREYDETLLVISRRLPMSCFSRLTGSPSLPSMSTGPIKNTRQVVLLSREYKFEFQWSYEKSWKINYLGPGSWLYVGKHQSLREPRQQ